MSDFKDLAFGISTKLVFGPLFAAAAAIMTVESVDAQQIDVHEGVQHNSTDGQQEVKKPDSSAESATSETEPFDISFKQPLRRLLVRTESLEGSKEISAGQQVEEEGFAQLTILQSLEHHAALELHDTTGVASFIIPLRRPAQESTAKITFAEFRNFERPLRRTLALQPLDCLLEAMNPAALGESAVDLNAVTKSDDRYASLDCGIVEHDIGQLTEPASQEPQKTFIDHGAEGAVKSILPMRRPDWKKTARITHAEFKNFVRPLQREQSPRKIDCLPEAVNSASPGEPVTGFHAFDKTNLKHDDSVRFSEPVCNVMRHEIGQLTTSPSREFIETIIDHDATRFAALARPLRRSAHVSEAKITSQEFKNLMQPLRRNNLQTQINCLAEAMYFEARGENEIGWYAVGETILNRVASDRFPDTVCDVIEQGVGQLHNCQFSYNCDGLAEIIREDEAYAQILDLAHSIMRGQAIHVTGGATHFHTVDVNPFWTSSMYKTAHIGRHIFYRDNK